jgi:uncharacterized protein YjbJ (UPF0337 family)
MNKTQAKGTGQKLTGEAQEGIGKAIKDKKLVAKGLGNRAAGMTKEQAGKAISAADRAIRQP